MPTPNGGAIHNELKTEGLHGSLCCMLVLAPVTGFPHDTQRCISMSWTLHYELIRKLRSDVLAFAAIAPQLPFRRCFKSLYADCRWLIWRTVISVSENW